MADYAYHWDKATPAGITSPERGYAQYGPLVIGVSDGAKGMYFAGPNGKVAIPELPDRWGKARLPFNKKFEGAMEKDANFRAAMTEAASAAGLSNPMQFLDLYGGIQNYNARDRTSFQKIAGTALPVIVGAGMGYGLLSGLGAGAGTSSSLGPTAASSGGVPTFASGWGGGLSTAAGTVPGSAGVGTVAGGTPGIFGGILGGGQGATSTLGAIQSIFKGAGGGAGGKNMGILDTIFGGGGGSMGDWADLAGAGLGLYGAYDAYRTGRDVAGQERNALAGLSTNLGPVTGVGPGGAGGAFDPTSGVSAFGAGELDPIRQLLTLYATGSVPGIGQGVPAGVQGAAGQGNLPDYASSALLQAFGGLTPAMENLQTAGGAGFQDVYNRVLGNLRQQAQPFETQAFNALQERQFGQGQMGTTGGGLQTEAFARGLGQADLSRQLAATGEARTNMSMADQLLQSAFGRFGQTASLFGDVNREGFARQLTMSQLPNILQSGQLGNVGAALQAQGGVNQQALNNFLAALQASTGAANARIGSGANVASLVGAPTFGTSQLGGAAGLSLLGDYLRGGSNASVTDVLGRIFGQGANQNIPGSTGPAGRV